jgi:ribosome-binding factor A
MGSRRQERINQVIRRVVAQKIIEDVKDPRVGFTTITRVVVSDDLTNADIYFSVLGDTKEKNSTLKILNHMAGYLQKGLGDALRTRITPKLSFHYDSDSEQSIKMSQLIEKARAGDADNNQKTSESEENEEE